MNYSRLIRFSWKEITRCKGRSVSNILGYFISIITFSAILTMLFFSEQALNNVLNNTGTHFISYKPMCCGLPYIYQTKQNFIANGIPSQPLLVSLLNDIKKIPEVLEASPYLLYKMFDDKRGRDFTIGGFDVKSKTTVGNTSCAAADIVSGRFLNENDTASVLLEESYAKSNVLHVNQNIVIAGVQLKIIGIVNPGIRPAKADVYMLIRTAEKVIGQQLNAPVQDIMNIVLVESKSAKVHNKAMVEVSKIMGKESLISSYGCFKPASSAMTINKNMLEFLFVVVFVFTIIIAFKNQYSSLVERKHDLGVLSAIGWSNKKIIGMILFESLLQIGFGGILALIVLSISAFTLPLQSILQTTIALDLISTGYVFILGFLTAAAAGIFASIVPAWISIKDVPAKNLRILY